MPKYKIIAPSVFVVLIGLFSAYWYFKEPNTFTFTVDMPPGFKYKATVYYVPAPGETCRVATKDNLAPVFNYWWREDYNPDSVIEIRRARKGCPLVIYNIKLEIFAAYGRERADVGSDGAQVVIKEKMEDSDVGSFNAEGESYFYGECRWMFKTSGGKRRIVKLLRCNDVNVGKITTGEGPVAGYTLDQLPGKTIKMKISIVDKETPAVGDTWLEFSNGWKRCMGEGFEDQYAFCNGNQEDFSHFIMPDGKQCTIYPGCTE